MSMELDIRNIAGIREGQATLHPGVNAVRALNWQGKSSFVEAIETALGAATTLTEGASDGEVSLAFDGQTARVELHRENGVVHRRGTPYLDDEYDRICARLYACLDDDNAVREAVRAGENLEELLTRPLDFEDIDARLADLVEERQAVETELERAEQAAKQLPAAQETVTTLEDELEALQAQRAELVAEQGEAVDDAEDVRDELSQARAERSKLTERIERLENTVERTEARLADLREQREAIEVPDVDIESELVAARDRLDRAERDVDLLQGLYSANKRILEEDRVDLVADVDRGLMADDVDCWICGSSAAIDDVEARVEQLGERVAALNEDANAARETIEELEAKRGEATQARREQQDLDRQITDLEGTLADRRESLTEARDQLTRVEDRIDDLADEVAETDERLTDLQSDIKYTESKLAEEREELADLEREAAQRELLAETLEELTEEITTLRERKSTVKQQTREAFDATIRELVSRFETSFETARLTSTFDLVVAREGREVSLDALSEGEVELLGIVAALAGYEAYDVGDRTPVLVLDGVSGLADENLHTLVEYLRDKADYLVFTAYPEHSPFEGHTVDPADWQVVSDDSDRRVAS